jgi:hypothetical protein
MIAQHSQQAPHAGPQASGGPRTVGPHCRAPLLGVLPEHLPAEHVCPAGQHTCSAEQVAPGEHGRQTYVFLRGWFV